MSETAVVENEVVESAETEEVEYEHGDLVDKEPSHLHKHYVEWIKEKTGVEVDPKAAQLSVVLYQKYQRSPENAERRERERDERDAKQAELKEQREKAAAEKKAKAEAERAEKAEKAKAAKAEKAEGSDEAPTKKPGVKKSPAKAKAASTVEAPF
jgi:colicin import membrane protein